MAIIDKEVERTFQAPRAEKLCESYGQMREHAAHGLCYACYRRENRAKDRHTPSKDEIREKKMQMKSYSAIMTSLIDLRVTEDDIAIFREMLCPYTRLIDPCVRENKKSELSEQPS